MHISISEAQGQLLELVRRAESGEEVLLTHDGKTIAKLDAVISPAPVETKTPQERRQAIRDIVSKFRRIDDGGPDAAHSQDFLYDDRGLPA